MSVFFSYPSRASSLKVMADSMARSSVPALCLSLFVGGCALARSARAWSPVCGCFTGNHQGTHRGQGFSGFRQSGRSTAGISRLAGSARRRRLPCPPFLLSGRDRTAFFPGNPSTAWELSVGISTFQLRQTGTDTNKNTNKSFRFCAGS